MKMIMKRPYFQLNLFGDTEDNCKLQQEYSNLTDIQYTVLTVYCKLTEPSTLIIYLIGYSTQQYFTNIGLIE